MSLGNSTWEIQAGSASLRQSAQSLARAVAHLGCSPVLTDNSIVSIGDSSAIPSSLGAGELAEICAFTARKGQAKYAVAVKPSLAGAVGTVTKVGDGAGTVAVSLAPWKAILARVVAGGALGTMSVQFSLDGGLTWGAAILSEAGVAWIIRVPGTYTYLNFNAATYVATKTLTVGVDGTVTPGSLWVGTVTQTSSPIDVYDVLLTILKAGALGTATVRVSLDGGNSTEFETLTPATGVIVIPGTGLVLTLASTFDATNTYAFPAKPPCGSTTDVNNALTALKNSRTVQVSLVHLTFMPSSAASAFSHAATLEAAALDAYANRDKDWEMSIDCPSNKGGMRIVSIAGRKQLRGLSWLAVDRYCDTDPRQGLGEKTPPLRAFLAAGATTIAGPGDVVVPVSTALHDTADVDSVIVGARGTDLLRTSVFVGGRDEYYQPGLDDVQINTARTYNGPLNVYLSVTKGIGGWKNLTTNATYADAAAVRALNVFVNSMRPFVENLLDADAEINDNGTISEAQASTWETMLDLEAKRIMGLVPGGDFSKPQCNKLIVTVLRSSQLGSTPKRLDISYKFQPKGRVSDIANKVEFAGQLSVSALAA